MKRQLSIRSLLIHFLFVILNIIIIIIIFPDKYISRDNHFLRRYHHCSLQNRNIFYSAREVLMQKRLQSEIAKEETS